MGSSLFDLSGKTALVTGGNGGIGYGIAKGLADAGASIVVAARNQAKTEEAVKTLQQNGSKAKGIHVDVSDEKSIGQLMVANYSLTSSHATYERKKFC